MNLNKTEEASRTEMILGGRLSIRMIVSSTSGALVVVVDWNDISQLGILNARHKRGFALL